MYMPPGKPVMRRPRPMQDDGADMRDRAMGMGVQMLKDMPAEGAQVAPQQPSPYPTKPPVLPTNAGGVRTLGATPRPPSNPQQQPPSSMAPAAPSSSMQAPRYNDAAMGRGVAMLSGSSAPQTKSAVPAGYAASSGLSQQAPPATAGTMQAQSTPGASGVRFSGAAPSLLPRNLALSTGPSSNLGFMNDQGELTTIGGARSAAAAQKQADDAAAQQATDKSMDQATAAANAPTRPGDLDEAARKRALELLGAPTDTSAQEALAQDAYQRNVGQGLVDARAGMGRAGFASSGAMAGVEGDVRRSAAGDYMAAVQGIKDKARGFDLSRTQAGLGYDTEDRRTDMQEKKFDLALQMLKDELGQGSGGGPSADPGALSQAHSHLDTDTKMDATTAEKGGYKFDRSYDDQYDVWTSPTNGMSILVPKAKKPVQAAPDDDYQNTPHTPT